MTKHFLQGIDTVVVRVSDIQRSKAWYTEKLGFKNIHHDEKIKLVVLDTYSPTSLTIWETSDPIIPNPATASYPIFRTGHAATAHQKLRDQHIQVSEIITDHVVTYFTFHDPDGNILEVCQVDE